LIDIIILTGGFGSRLDSISNGTPKALMPIGNLVYLDILLQKVFKYSISRVYLSLFYKSNLFEDYINQSSFVNRLMAVIEPKPLGTGGAINFVVNNSKISSPFFVINGDSISNINLNTMVTTFEKKKLIAMIGISETEDAYRYGAVIEKKGKVLSFNEKSVRGNGWINNGHYIFRKEVFDEFSNTFSLEKDIFPKLIQNNNLGAFKVVNDSFIDMGVPEDYEKLCNMYKSLR